MIDAIDAPLGKFPKALGNVAILESKGIHSLLSSLIAQLQSSGFLLDPALLRALLPLVKEEDQQTFLEIINMIQELEDKIFTFEKDFKVEVHKRIHFSKN